MKRAAGCPIAPASGISVSAACVNTGEKTVKQLTESLEDYLEAIAELIAVEGHAHSKEIAEKLHVKMPSVTGALRQLEAMGFIVYNTHYPVELTVEGRIEAERIINRHHVLKRFFSEILGLGLDRASDTACRLEHVVDEDTVERFVLFSRAIENRADAKSLQIYLTEAMENLGREDFASFCVLSELKSGESAVVDRFGRNLDRSVVPDIAPGNQVTMSGMSLDRSSCRILRDGQRTEIPVGVAENIWVKRIPSR